MRAPELRLFQGELVVDNFAGGGGASCGIEAAIGRPADIAINHSPLAIRMHEANHPETRHYVENIWEVDPREACGGNPVGLVWFSPDCKHFSKAKGRTPVSKQIRGLAWTVIRWMRAVRPRICILENVEEFQTWGPLLQDEKGDHYPDPDRKGETFDQFTASIKHEGYSVEWKLMNAADYGTPTTRRRLFLIARRDQDHLVFPKQSHAKGGEGGLRPWVPVHEVINWEHEVESLWSPRRLKKPLAEATMNRIAMGMQRFVAAGDPFIVRHGHYSKTTGAGLRPGKGAGLFRGQSLHDPLATVCATTDKNLVVPWLIKHYGGMIGNPMTDTLGTVTTRDSQALAEAKLWPAMEPPEGYADRSEQVWAYLIKYYGTGVAKSLFEPLGTITTKARFALIKVQGIDYRIVDIGMRMIQPDELYRAQGFPDGYRFQADADGKKFTKEQQTAAVGNSVCPDVARELVAAQRF